MNSRSKDAQTDDDIDLWRVMENIKDGWYWIVGGGTLGLLAGAAMTTSTPIMYEARAVVLPATVTATVVEPAAHTVERLKLTTFYSDQTVGQCGAGSAGELAGRVAASLGKASNLIFISYRAKTGAQASTCMNSIVAKLIQSQLEIGTPLIRVLEEQLVSTKKQMDDIERFLAAADQRADRPAVSYDLSIRSVLKRDELTRLQKSYREQRIQLTGPLTQSMRLLEPIEVSVRPASSGRRASLALGLLGGLCVGLFALVLSQRRRRHG